MHITPLLLRRAIIFAGLLALLFVGASAQVVFSVTATANSTAQGYTSGQAYTFSFTSVGSYAVPTSSYTIATDRFYVAEELTTDPQLWSSLSGSGLLGSFVRPVSTLNAPFSFIDWDNRTVLSNPHDLNLGAETDSTDTLGVTTLTGTAVRLFDVSLVGVTNYTLPTPPTYVDPVAYSQGYAGTYAVGGGSQVSLADVNGTQLMSFAVSSLTISAVPEPATTVAVLGFAALALAWTRRRARVRHGG
jgi:hypothetical protein